MANLAQTNLKEPEKVDWNNYNSGSKFTPPPPAFGPDDKAIVYYGQAVAAETEADEDYLNFLLDPIKIIKSGTADGYVIRFTRASVKPFMKNGAPIKGNPNKLANYLRACGISAKPQSNDEYRQAVSLANGKPFPFVLDWEAYNKDTGEAIRGYRAFPIDSATGERKSILRKGDLYNVLGADRKPTGQTAVVQSEILFANARLSFFQDASRQRS